MNGKIGDLVRIAVPHPGPHTIDSIRQYVDGKLCDMYWGVVVGSYHEGTTEIKLTQGMGWREDVTHGFGDD